MHILIHTILFIDFNMLKALILLLSLSFLIFGVSCNDEPDIENPLDQIDFGTCDFVAVGNCWVYSAEGVSEDSALVIEIESKHPEYEQVYKVRNTYLGEQTEYSYWYIDGEYLKVFKLNEPILDAHPIYKLEDIYIGEEWQGQDGDKYFFYDVDSLSVNHSCEIGDYVCNVIKVGFSGAFNKQYNYWNDTIGLIYIRNDFANNYSLKSINF